MLTKLKNGVPVWAEAIHEGPDGVRHDTRAIAQVWNDEELEAIGLYRPAVLPASPGFGYEWDGGVWVAPAPTLEEQQARRAAAYRDEADPLFFKVQRGEADTQEWLDKVAEIRARYPYPEE
jgi:hypothetical protein